MGFKFYNIFNLKKKWQVDLVNIAFSLIITVSLVCLTYFLKIPNPNLILFTGLIVLTSLFGFIPGSVALLGVWFYSLFFFSDYTFIKFTEQNAIKTVVSFITSVLCYFFVGGLNLLYKRDATKIIAANKLLMESNERLEEISSIDSLTKTKNRYSLRKDFETYLHQEVYVMIFDIDEFKNINDKHGHIMGDKILMSVGEATQKIFSIENSYRYGGDEFVIIQKETTLVEFKHQIKSLMNDISKIEVANKEIKLHISVGFTYGIPANHQELREMLQYADILLYEVKRGGKNNILGHRFEEDL